MLVQAKFQEFLAFTFPLACRDFRLRFGSEKDGAGWLCH
jgi:hypothetical protein